MTNLDEQFLIAHPSEVTAMDANVGQLFGPNPSLLPGEREGSLSQRWLWSASQSDSAPCDRDRA